MASVKVDPLEEAKLVAPMPEKPPEQKRAADPPKKNGDKKKEEVAVADTAPPAKVWRVEGDYQRVSLSGQVTHLRNGHKIDEAVYSTDTVAALRMQGVKLAPWTE